MCKVSAIIPTYNRAGRLGQALESVVAQNRPPEEIIVVDDGSTDETAALVAQRFPSVRYIYQPRSGVSSARNRGIAAAGSEWLAFLDSDDCWMPDKLARQVDALRSRPVERIAHTDEIWIRNARRVNPGKRHAKAGGDIYPQCLPLCAISPSSVIMHRSVFDDVGLFDESLPACEDYDMWLRVCSRYTVRFIAEALVVKHGGHEDQLSRQYAAMDRFRVRALCKMLDSGVLDSEYRRLTAQTLVEKARVYVKGARRRRKYAEAAEHEALIARYGALLQ